MSSQFYISSYNDLKDMGCDGAAQELLREGCAALPDCAELAQLAKKEGISLAPPKPAAATSIYQGPAPTPATPTPPAAPPEQAASWRPPPSPHPDPNRVASKPSVKKYFDAQATLAAFAEADHSTWAGICSRLGGDMKKILAEEARLRSLVIEAFHECKEDLRHLVGVEARSELLRQPCTPDLSSRIQDASTTGNPFTLLKEVIAQSFSSQVVLPANLWDVEGPGAYLQLAHRLSMSEAPIPRAREIARTGPGSTHSLLEAIAKETRHVVAASPPQTAEVLVIGGVGASAVAALQAQAKRVVIWEKNAFLAGIAQEILQRNVAEADCSRCTIVQEEKVPSGKWDLVVVDLWHGVGGLSCGPLEVLREVLLAKGSQCTRVVPETLSVDVALADGRLKATSGFDLSLLDHRFRGLAAAPLHIERLEDEAAHPTSLRPELLTSAVPAVELNLLGQNAPKDGPAQLQFQATQSGVATMAVFSMTFKVTKDAEPVVIRLGQWLAGGYSVEQGKPVTGFSFRRGQGKVWVDWDWGAAREPPMGYMNMSDWYYEMLRDGARHDLYERGIRAEVEATLSSKKSCRVLDVGSGDGILSMMALRAGATHSVGVEVVTPIARLSEEIVKSNRPGGVASSAPLPSVELAPLDIWCTDVRGVSPPPEQLKFDVLVSELMDAGGLGENLILLTRGARRRLCHPEAPVVPASLRLCGVLCHAQLPPLDGVNMDAYWPFWPFDRSEESLWTAIDLDKGEGSFRVLTEPAEFLSLELGVADVNDVPARKEVDFKGVADGVANCIVWWFEVQLSKKDPSAVLTNAPKCLDPRHAATCWGQAMAGLAPLPVTPGQAAEVTMEVPFGDYQLCFKPRGTASVSRVAKAIPQPPPGAEPYSSTFIAMLQEHRAYRVETEKLTREQPIGQTSLRSGDIAGLNALQQTALCVASQSFLFGVEPSIASKMLAGWYSVGGEGRN